MQKVVFFVLEVNVSVLDLVGAEPRSCASLRLRLVSGLLHPPRMVVR